MGNFTIVATARVEMIASTRLLCALLATALAGCATSTGHGFRYGERVAFHTKRLADARRPSHPACRLFIVCTTDCPFCNARAAKNPLEGVWFLLGTETQVAQFARAHGIPAENVEWLDTSHASSTLHKLNLTGTPTGIAVDRKNIVRDIRMDNVSQAMADSACAIAN